MPHVMLGMMSRHSNHLLASWGRVRHFGFRTQWQTIGCLPPWQTMCQPGALPAFAGVGDRAGLGRQLVAVMTTAAAAAAANVVEMTGLRMVWVLSFPVTPATLHDVCGLGMLSCAWRSSTMSMDAVR